MKEGRFLKESTAVMEIPKSEEDTRVIRKKIGNTVYMVSVRFSETSREKMEDKILRLAKYDVENMKEAVGE